MGSISNIDFFTDAINKDRNGNRKIKVIQYSKEEIFNYTQVRVGLIKYFKKYPLLADKTFLGKCETCGYVVNASRRTIKFRTIHYNNHACLNCA
jgi:hypothetical protein